jgi:ABC-type phosphate transport system substrate-binding protein
MTSLSVRRLALACVVSAAAIAAVASPGTASAASDLTHQCGSEQGIKGLGSTFQAPAEAVWTGNFNTSKNEFACNGEHPKEGTKDKPEVKYEQGEAAQRGSGNCLKDFGAGAAPKLGEYPYCGTDEAPTVAKIEEMEEKKENKKKGEKEVETIPTAQGAVAVLIHLPEGCKAESTVPSGISKIKLGRLALDNTTVEGIFRGTIRDWKEVEEAQTDNLTKITCTGGAAEEETPISVVVRLDKSGTTHIFKSYLAQVFTGEWEAEEFNEPEGAGKGKPCGEVKPAKEKVTWKKVQEGCENQRWPEAAKVVRPATTGNPAVIEEVNAKASSITYADLAVAREKAHFSKKGEGGENKKGTATKVGEQNHKFWAEVQNSAAPGTYADPGSTGDVEKIANSNCAATVYASEPGEKFPPKTTRETWFAVKAELVQKKYNICGLTYELALRTYKPFLSPKTPGEEEEDKNKAQTVRDFLTYAVNAKVEGGGALLKNHDYEKVSGTVAKEAETGIKEIGFASP